MAEPCKTTPPRRSSGRAAMDRSGSRRGATGPGSISGIPPGREGSGPGSQADEQSQRVDRRAPAYVVAIEGQDLKQAGLAKHVTHLHVEESWGTIPVVTMTVHNDALAYTDESLWTEGNKLDVRTGYVGTGLEQRGRFIIQEVRWNHRKTREPTITILAYGEQILMARQQRRLNYLEKRDSEIAEEVAGRYGWAADVDQTEPVHRQVAQPGWTDLELLQERAKLHGFELAVVDGTLHFHAPRWEESGISLIYDKSEQSQLSSLDVSSHAHRRGAVFHATQIDPITKEVIDLDSSNEPDPITAEAMGRSQSGLVLASEVTKVDGEQPVWFLTGEGHEQNRGQIQEQADGFARHTDWLVDGEGTAIGLEKMRAGTMIEIIGVGKTSGWYRVMSAKHIIEGTRGYRVEFGVARAWHEKPRGSGRRRGSGQLSGLGVGDDVSTASLRMGVVAL